jgi:hypothetical protein
LFASPLSFIPSAFAGPPVTEPDNPAQAEKERQAQREFDREMRVRRDIERERGSWQEHLRRMPEDFAKGTIEGVLSFSFLETVTGTAGIKKVLTECATGCHAPKVVQKLKMVTDRLGSSGQDQRDRKKLEQRMKELRLLDETVVLRTEVPEHFSTPSRPIGTPGGPNKSPV